MFQASTDYLAYAEAWRFVVANTGAVLYLSWDRSALRLSPAELVDIAHFLPAARAQVAQPLMCCGDQTYCLVHDEFDHYHVWLLGLGLYLSAAELDMLTRLVQQAMQRLLQRHLPATPTTPGTFAHVGQRPFSIN